MLSLSIPAIISIVVVGLYNFMDRVFVGQLINEVAMGAVSVSYPFTLINTSVGSASVLSRAIGKKDQDTVDKIMGNLIAMNLLLGAVITVAMTLWYFLTKSKVVRIHRVRLENSLISIFLPGGQYRHRSYRR